MASIVKFVRSCFSYDSHCMHLKDTRNIYRFFTLSFQICFARRVIVIRAIRRKSNNIDQTIPRFHFPRTWKSEWIASPCVTAELIGLVHDNPEAIAAGYRRRLSGGTRANRRRRRRRPVTEHSAGGSSFSPFSLPLTGFSPVSIYRETGTEKPAQCRLLLASKRREDRPRSTHFPFVIFFLLEGYFWLIYFLSSLLVFFCSRKVSRYGYRVLSNFFKYAIVLGMFTFYDWYLKV